MVLALSMFAGLLVIRVLVVGHLSGSFGHMKLTELVRLGSGACQPGGLNRKSRASVPSPTRIDPDPAIKVSHAGVKKTGSGHAGAADLEGVEAGHHAEIERLYLRLAVVNAGIAELEKVQPQSEISKA